MRVSTERRNVGGKNRKTAMVSEALGLAWDQGKKGKEQVRYRGGESGLQSFVRPWSPLGGEIKAGPATPNSSVERKRASSERETADFQQNGAKSEKDDGRSDAPCKVCGREKGKQRK